MKGAQKICCILGPTASGKSALAMYLADQFKATRPIEIISVDSALVYRNMDIGTAKPSLAERALVPHHLIDLIDPTEAYSAAKFVEQASATMREIQGRGHTPILVGGTMLYIKALIEGMHALPASDPLIRERVHSEALDKGWPRMHEELSAIDPITAQRLQPNDAQRIGRAMELFRQSGRTMSAWLADERPDTEGFQYQILSLEPSDRSVLHQRIELRFKAMLAQGFLDEVRKLRARGDLHPNLASMRCVGYRQAWQWLEDGAHHEAHLIEQGVIATRQLAKRQMTWLRAMPSRTTLDCLSANLHGQALALVKPILSA